MLGCHVGTTLEALRGFGGSYWDNYWDDMKQGYRNHRIYEYGNIDAIYEFLYMPARSFHRGYVYIYIYLSIRKYYILVNIGKLSDGLL